MVAKGQRRAIHAYISDEAHDAYNTFAEENGISVTGLIQALAEQLAEELETGQADEVWKPTVKLARRIDATNRRRSR
jgi:uncharacterized protein YdbL (DUF1318 family)